MVLGGSNRLFEVRSNNPNRFERMIGIGNQRYENKTLCFVLLMLIKKSSFSSLS